MEVIILTGHGSIESAFRSAREGAYEYSLKPCEFDDLVKAINNAYAKRIKALSGAKASQVDDLMKQSGDIQPLTLLGRLKKVHDDVSTYMSAAALAEGGDPYSARELMGDATDRKSKE